MKSRAADGIDAVVDAIDDLWPEELMAVGTADDCLRQIQRYYDAGADSVVLYPMPSERSTALIQRAADDVVPHVRPGRPSDRD